MSREVAFRKIHGTGNDFVVLDAKLNDLQDVDFAKLARGLCHRNFGIGADGLIIVRPCENKAQKLDGEMVIHNADGSLAGMCGNGLRCVAKYVHDYWPGCRGRTLQLLTGDGVKQATITPGPDGTAVQVTIDMGQPALRAADVPVSLSHIQGLKAESLLVNREYRLKLPVGAERLTLPGGKTGAKDKAAGTAAAVAADAKSDATKAEPEAAATVTIPLSAVNTGVPHCVVYAPGQLKDFPIGRLGPLLEQDRQGLFPKGTNVNFVQVVSRERVVQRTWERGVGAETLACGTGACAVAVVGYLTNRTNAKLAVSLPGGDLQIEYQPGETKTSPPDDTGKSSALSTATAAVTAEGTLVTPGRVFMTGPAVEVFSGKVDIARFL